MHAVGLMVPLRRYNKAVKVGPSAYPHLTGQKECPDRLSIEDLEHSRHCFEDDYEIIPNMVFKQEGACDTERVQQQ